MRTAKILTLTLLIGLMGLLAAPAMATQPRMTYSWVGYSTPTTDPGMRFTSADKISHVIGSTGGSVMIGTFGTGTSIDHSTYQLDLATYTGNGIDHPVDTYPTGTMEGIVNMKFIGLGLYTYHGPTMQVGSQTVSEGNKFYGLLLEGSVAKHGTSGDLQNIQLRGESSGVFVAVGPLKGYGILTESGIYWTAG